MSFAYFCCILRNIVNLIRYREKEKQRFDAISFFVRLLISTCATSFVDNTKNARKKEFDKTEDCQQHDVDNPKAILFFMAALLKEGARNFRCALFASSPWEYAAFYASVKARRCLARLVYPAIHGDRRERFSWSNIEFVGELHRNRFIICIVRAGSIAVYFDGRKIFEYSHNGDTAFCKRNSLKLLKSYRRTKNFSLLLNYSKHKLPTDLLPSSRSALSIYSTNFGILFEGLRMYKFLHDTDRDRSPTISMTANDVAVYCRRCSDVFVAETVLAQQRPFTPTFFLRELFWRNPRRVSRMNKFTRRDGTVSRFNDV